MSLPSIGKGAFMPLAAGASAGVQADAMPLLPEDIELGPGATESEKESWFRQSFDGALDAEAAEDGGDLGDDTSGDITEEDREAIVLRSFGRKPEEGASRIGVLTFCFLDGGGAAGYMTREDALRCVDCYARIVPLLTATFRTGIPGDEALLYPKGLPDPRGTTIPAASVAARPTPITDAHYRWRRRAIRRRAIWIRLLQSAILLLIGFTLRSVTLGRSECLVDPAAALLLALAALLMREKGRSI